MGNCTRHIVLESLRTIVEFFQRYAAPTSHSTSREEEKLSYAHPETEAYRCAFILPATIRNLPPPMVRASDISENRKKDDNYIDDDYNSSTKQKTSSSAPEPSISFETPLNEIELSILKLFDDVTKALNGVTRVDQRIHLNSNTDGASEKLFDVCKDEIEVQSLRNELISIIRYNLYRPDQPKKSLGK